MTNIFTLISSPQRLGRCGALLMLSTLSGSAYAQSFGPVSAYPVANSNGALYAVAVGDVTGDGRPDIVAPDFLAGNVRVLPALPGGGFGASVASAGSASGGPQGVALGDLNGDGRLDIVVTNTFASNVEVLLGQAGGGLAPPSFYSTGTSTTAASSAPRGVALGDVTGDGRLDIITANGASDNVGVLAGLATGGFAAVSSYPTGAGSEPTGVVVADMNGDGRPDLVSANRGTDNVSVLLRQAGGGFAAVSTYSTGAVSIPDKLAVGDVNGDGRPDVITTNFAARGVSVLLALASGGFAAPTSYAAGASPYDVKLGDVNGDGRLDIVTANGAANTVGVLLGQAGGGFASASAFATGANSQPIAVALGDANADGRPDVVTAYYGTATVGVLLNTGTFAPLATTRPTAAEVTLFPNPAHETFTVQQSAGFSATQAELLNALGQVVRRPAARGPLFQVEASGLVPGVYLLRLTSGGAVLTKRVVVE